MELLVTTESDQRGRPNSPINEEARTSVLLVEDTEDNRVMMRRLLEMSGYRVSVAINGAEAVQKAERVSPQVILMDLSLPVIDGLAATRQIRNVPRLKEVPIIAVSAHDTMDFHAEALAAGCDAYITKPIDFDELQGLIEQMLVR
jgi:CheY-like chemotaxis protein